ncbi:Hsp20 family protein [Bacillus sp. DTU_2020_1000418_1_SI_GHA_SEK_038]|uniref:Hsp20 family protein n=1 Tax=Bacillus sp. DTU_2020_1000418_1_SI_GHA_SEK_038 TaxID=3077585 RepID=UPI0028E7571A|nr:Hsp20 family protein [Bacillus sp. DTU_2020_1000418_1_SI_GHA_SEK_038]WNS73988.1 Hsp20 family protein [Bacillus sp. DTU_2020_1000418_1_SI_GHA_SEK_038]
MSNDSKKGKNEMGDLMKSMNQFFNEKPVRGFLQTMDEFFRNPFPFHSPFHVDVRETAEEHIITAELPGVKREQIQLDVLDNYVTISVQSHEILTEEDENQKMIKKRQSMQRSSRTIPLPQTITESKVKASYQNGLLKIRVPKQKGKHINIDEIE